LRRAVVFGSALFYACFKPYEQFTPTPQSGMGVYCNTYLFYSRTLMILRRIRRA